jgi:hypothetical protein
VASIPVAGIAGSSALSQYGQSIAELTETAALLRDADTIRTPPPRRPPRPGFPVERLRRFSQPPPADCTDTLRRPARHLRGALQRPVVAERRGAADLQRLWARRPAPASTETAISGAAFASGGYALGDFVLGPSRSGGAARRLSGARGWPLVAVAAVPSCSTGSATTTSATMRATAHDLAARPRRRALASTGKRPTSCRPALIEQLRASSGPLTRIGDSAGGEAYAYSISAPDRGMRVMVALPAAEAQREARRALMASLAQLALFLAACLLAIIYGPSCPARGRCGGLAGRVRAWQPGTPFAAPRSQWDPDEVVAARRCGDRAAETISARGGADPAPCTSETCLLAEIHHR